MTLKLRQIRFRRWGSSDALPDSLVGYGGIQGEASTVVRKTVRNEEKQSINYLPSDKTTTKTKDKNMIAMLYILRPLGR